MASFSTGRRWISGGSKGTGSGTIFYSDDGISWFDAGTVEDLYEASSFIQSIEKRQNTLIGSIEEVAFNNGWIDSNQLESRIVDIKNTEYGMHLFNKYFKTPK